jgi:hypothetical protein
MSSLICLRAVGFSDSRATCRTYGSRADSPRAAEPQEPICVRVRVRQQDDPSPGPLHVRGGKLDLDRLPVGVHLDCYM